MKNRVNGPGGYRCAAIAASAGLALGVLTMSASAQVEWRSGTAATTKSMQDVELQQRLATFAGAGESRHALVKMTAIPNKAERAALAAEGVRLLRFVGDNSFFASIDGDLADGRQPLTNRMVSRVDQIERRWKLHEDLNAGVLHPWMVVRQELDAKSDPNDVESVKQARVRTVVALYVQFHSDVDLETGAEAVKRFGATVRSRLESVNGVVIEMPYAQVNALADDDAVQWVEPPLPAFEEINAENRAITGADVVQAAPYGLDGAGVQVLVYDGGSVLTSHSDFSGRAVIGMSDTAGLSDHATHVAGTIGGDGTQNPMHKGMAPGVDIISYGFEQEGGLSEGFLYTDPGDLEADYTEAINVYGADISNNSIGTNTAPNGFPCEWEGNYGLTGSLIDAIAKGSLGSPFRIVWANGNERQGFASCGSTYLTTAPPACAKNHITVGALNANDDSVTDFTSWGPADDGRIKPDLSGPGCQSDGDGGVTSLSSSGGYSTKCGTSMASPTVCGLGALLLQDFRQQYPGEPDFRNSTLKAILANTAQDIVTAGPDYQSGYGSVRIQPAVDLLRAGNFAENEVDQGDTVGFVVVVNPGEELKITIAWDDEPGTPNVNPVLVNDLDLVVTSPSGTRFYPWTLDPANPADPAVQTQEDHVNNIEQVYVANPEAGGWSVEVRGFSVPTGPQSFSIAATPFLVNCSSSGIVTLNSSRYACEDTASLKVVDCDLNTSDSVTDTVDVLITSDTDPVGMMVTLTETAPESAAFLADVDLSASGAPGALAVSDGDTVTLSYIDADDGEGGMNITVTDTATIDCVAPIISNVVVTDIDARNATITFDTNEPATPVVNYGASCGSPTDAANGAALNTSHTVTLTGLDDNTGYFFTIDVTDEAGNGASDDNGGSCYAFMTPEVPDFFTEVFTGGIDLDGYTLTFEPNGSVDFYGACVEPAAQLPTNPAGGNAMTLSDDDTETVTLGGGATAPFYGTSYGSFFVSSNGNITFDAADTDYSETISEHFDNVRIAAMWDDLNPSDGGTVSWKQEADHVAVTWENVPQYNTGDSNTFQVQLFFDGRVTITHLGLGSGDAIVGLSNGGGISPDFFETDLSEVGNCGPRPPIAVGGSYATAIGTSVTMQLEATDDGLPGGPISLHVSSLPSNGYLVDLGTGQLIDSTPWALSGDMVKYAPAGLYQGTDSFSFFGDDGGMAPDGGAGNPAAVGITIGGPQAVHEFLVDDMNPGWATTGDWAFGIPDGVDGDPTGGFTGNNVYGYNLAGEYPNNMGMETLTSGAINMSGVTGSEVTFQRWLGVESSTYDHATFQVSNDGSNWNTVWDHSGSTLTESSWSEHTYDISATADGQSAVYLRWIMGTTDGSVTYHGWNIDDVVLSGLQPAAPCPGDVTLDGLVNFDDLNVILTNWDSVGTAVTEGDADGDGDTDFDDLNEVLTNWQADCNS